VRRTEPTYGSCPWLFSSDHVICLLTFWANFLLLFTVLKALLLFNLTLKKSGFMFIFLFASLSESE
jgi:hypothetical protein